MKKILAFLMLVCVIVSTLFATAVSVSAEDSNTVVMTVSGMTENGSKILTEHYYNFESAWNDAARYAKDHEWMQQNGVICIVVDLQADWIAEKGKFGKDNEGFKESTIYIPENTKMMINMQGHTIDRGLTKAEDHGEVIFMGKNSTLIINGGYIKDDIVEVGKSELNKDKMGTITGGYSDSGAGGIHLDGYNNLTLNNVNIVGNGTKGERGAGIALFNDSTLTMNGGSISDNHLHRYVIPFINTWFPYGSLYVSNSSATLNNVKISGNYTHEDHVYGVAIYALSSYLTMNDCIVSDNGLKNTKDQKSARSVIHANVSEVNITDTIFANNSTSDIPETKQEPVYISHLFYIERSNLTLEWSEMTQNNAQRLVGVYNGNACIKGVTIDNNNSEILSVANNPPKKVWLDRCTLGNNDPTTGSADISTTTAGVLEIVDCTLGDTTFSDKSMVAGVGVGSIFGEGSLSMIVAILALIASGVAIFLIVDMKKKLVPAAVGDDSKTEDEE